MQRTIYTEVKPYVDPHTVPPTPPRKKFPLALILAILFGLTSLGLGGYLIYDLCFKTKPNIATTEAPLSTPEVALQEALQVNPSLAANLTHRTFVLDNRLEERIVFTSDKDFSLYFYTDPGSDIAKFGISTEHGNYSIDNDLIALYDSDKADTFQRVGNYLVKESDNLTHTASQIYFDLEQLPTITTNINYALKNYLSTWGSNTSAKADKASIEYFRCTVTDKRLSGADSFLCDTDFLIYFNPAKVAESLKLNQLNSFAELCIKDPSYAFYQGECNNSNNSIKLNRKLAIRIKGDDRQPQNYSITSLYSDEQLEKEPTK